MDDGEENNLCIEMQQRKRVTSAQKMDEGLRNVN